MSIAQHSDKVTILDFALESEFPLVYDRRYERYLTPAIPDDAQSRKFFEGVKRVHKEGYTGAGVTVGIVDTGLLREHPALAHHCIASKNFSSSSDDVDRHGHGTLVALLIQSIAPDVSFVSAKALNDAGEGNKDDLIKAMRWVGGQGIDVLNVSVGVGKDEPVSDCLCDVCSETNRLGLNGILVCAALGNDPSKSYHPGSASDVITTSVLGERGFPFYIVERSQQMRSPDITVPEFVVPTLGGPYDGATSMGTAYLSGSCALLMEVLVERQLGAISPTELEKTGIPKTEIANLCNTFGVIAYRKHQIPKAIDWYRFALTKSPDDNRARSNLGMAYAEAGDPQSALREFKLVLERDSQNAEAHINTGHVYDLLKEDDLAINEFRKALELDPSSALAMKNLAFMISKGDPGSSEAEDLLGRAVLIDPNNAEVHNDLGVILEEKGKLAKALVHYEEAIRLAPYWELPRKNRMRVLRLIGSVEI